jgi:hypothetical protein
MEWMKNLHHAGVIVAIGILHSVEQMDIIVNGELVFWKSIVKKLVRSIL